ncbi:hypothetical protein IJ541_01675 [bacterium]|nr:hypothetical protein [bacterium]
MKVYSIDNYNLNCQKPQPKLNTVQANTNQMSAISFTSDDSKSSNAMRNTAMALMLAGTLSSCDKLFDDGEAYALAQVAVEQNDSTSHGSEGEKGWLRDSTYIHDTDSIIKWYYKFVRPQPLDTLYKNVHNWGIEGADADPNDSTANRNIVHYEGVRDWEYGTKEIGDENPIQSSKKVLVYDTEVKDYKNNHEYYGKRIFRFPTGNFSIKMPNGKILNNPKGLFMEELRSDLDVAHDEISGCTKLSSVFVTTKGDTVEVARKSPNSSEFIAKGKMTKGYLNGGINSLLLRNMIGIYDTDDHFLDFKIETVNDEELRRRYVRAMDNLDTEE